MQVMEIGEKSNIIREYKRVPDWVEDTASRRECSGLVGILAPGGGDLGGELSIHVLFIRKQNLSKYMMIYISLF